MPVRLVALPVRQNKYEIVLKGNFLEKGIVLKKLSNKFWVEDISNLFICSARGNLKDNGIFVGDNVLFNADALNIKEVLKRKNLLVRPPLANLEQMIIVLAYAPKPDYLMLDKLLLFCGINKINPIICLNKIEVNKDENEYIKKAYGKFYSVLEISAHKKINIDKLKKLLKGKISASAGQSGVGKSALINSIFDDEKTAEGYLSEKILRGKNTTRHCELFKVSGKTYIADTPGFSALSINLLNISYRDLPAFYPDFADFSDNCKYNSCMHLKEIDCAVKEAVKTGLIDNERYQRYTIILEDLKEFDKKIKYSRKNV
ncbi:MAG: ribosome small subunit-dependent GTPase A [Clostridia bacterium]|nr:ribosome small subunit-dependent GTPase A [Clostridia bacterium]